jgi:hypothetical protein
VPVHDTPVLDDFHHVELVAPAHRVLRLRARARLDARAHRRALDGEIELDAVAGERVGAPRADRLEDP